MSKQKREELTSTVISLIEQGKGFHPSFISNQQIYKEITGLQRFSRKRWEQLKPLLRKLNGTKIGNKELFGYAPMLRSYYNFKAIEGAPNDYRYIAGFQLVIRNE